MNTSGNLAGLSGSSGTVFILSCPESGLFLFKMQDANKWLQHSGSGKGIRYYTANSDATNSRIKIIFADTAAMPDDWYHLNGKSYGLMNYSGGTPGNACMAQANENYLSML